MAGQVLWGGPRDGAATIVLAHGAGSPMDSAWLERMCALLGDRGVRTARFEFAYMAGRRQGVRKPAPRAELVLPEYRDAVAAIREKASGRLLIGGKSYGGRVASLVADELDVEGVVCLGYPFHPPARPQQLRTAHLETITTPTLICQGARDPFGGADEVPGYAPAPAIQIVWFDGAHDLAPLSRLGGVADVVAEFSTRPR